MAFSWMKGRKKSPNEEGGDSDNRNLEDSNQSDGDPRAAREPTNAPAKGDKKKAAKAQAKSVEPPAGPTLNEVQKELDAEKIKATSLKGELDEAKAKVDRLTQEIAATKEIGEQLTDADKKREIFQDALQDIVSAMEPAFPGTRGKSEQEIDSIVENVKVVVKEWGDFRSLIDTLKIDNQRLKSVEGQLDTLRKAHDKAAQEAHDKAEGLRLREQGINEKEVSLESSRQVLATQQAELQMGQEKLAGLESDLKETKGLVKTLELEKAQVAADYAKEVGTTAKLQQDIGAMNARITNLENDLSQVSTERNSHRLKFEEATKRAGELQGQLATALANFDDLKTTKSKTDQELQKRVEDIKKLSADIQQIKTDLSRKEEEHGELQKQCALLRANQIPTGFLPPFVAAEDFAERLEALKQSEPESGEGIAARRVLSSLAALQAELAAGAPAEKHEDALRQILPLLGRHLYASYESAAPADTNREMAVWESKVNEACAERGFSVTTFRANTPPNPQFMEMIGNGPTIKKVISWLVKQQGTKVKGAVVVV